MRVTAATHLVSMFVRATSAKRVLEIGTGAASSGLTIAQALPPGGTLITLERDAALAAEARRTFAAAGHTGNVIVMAADARRFVHKLAGPFDLVFLDGDHEQYPALHDRLVQRLAPSATLITNDVRNTADYNVVLAADVRLATVVLNIGNGVAVSVKRDEASPRMIRT